MHIHNSCIKYKTKTLKVAKLHNKKVYAEYHDSWQHFATFRKCLLINVQDCSAQSSVWFSF